MKKMILAALVGSVVSGPAWGEVTYIYGNELHSNCQSEVLWEMAACTFYILGVTDSLNGKNAGIGGVTFCNPASVTRQQNHDIVKSWLDNNPQHRHIHASVLVVKALSKAFPCR